MTGFGSIRALPTTDFRSKRTGNRNVRCGSGGVTYRGYTIVEKRDFGDHGFYERGFTIKHGFVVTDGGIVNEMPGATWFYTLDDAMKAIDDLVDSGRGFVITSGEHPFWALNRFRRNCEERAPELALLLQQLVSHLDASGFPPRLEATVAQAQALLDQIDNNCDTRPSRGPIDGPWTRDGERKVGRFGGVMPKDAPES